MTYWYLLRRDLTHLTTRNTVQNERVNKSTLVRSPPQFADLENIYSLFASFIWINQPEMPGVITVHHDGENRGSWAGKSRMLAAKFEMTLIIVNANRDINKMVLFRQRLFRISHCGAENCFLWKTKVNIAFQNFHKGTSKNSTFVTDAVSPSSDSFLIN